MKARENLLRVMQSGLFDWEAAAHQVHGFVEKAAALFVLTKDQENYELLCWKTLSQAAVSQTENAILPLLKPDESLQELQQKALEMARWNEQAVLGKSGSEPSRHWRELILGMAEYRCGNDEAALNVLSSAREAFNLNCSGTAYAFSALLAHRSGQIEEAADFLATAQSQFQQLLQSFPAGLGSDWEHLAIFRIALQEAEDTVNEEPQH